MANEEHEAILKEGQNVWNSWRYKQPKLEPDLSGTFLKGVNLDSYDLRCTNLRGAAIIESDLSHVNLESANLEWAKLGRTRFSGASLLNANLHRAHLGQTVFESTDAKRAVFSEAILQNTLFRYSDLDGANFSNALLLETGFIQINLTRVLGLESCDCRGNSILDHRTLLISRDLPEAFLRGCGIPDQLIAFLPSLFNDPLRFYSCFISYSHQDKPFARRLHDQLQSNGIRCWLDDHQVLPGDDLYDEVDRGISFWDKVLLCCSRASMNSPWIHREIDKALQKEERRWRDRGEKVLAIIPLNLDGYLFEWQDGKASMLKSRLAADFTGWETDNAKFKEQCKRVVKALRADQGARERPPEPRL